MKGQTAVEMIIYIGFMMLILTVAMVSIVDREIILRQERIGMDSKAVAETVASEINIALSVGNGYSHSFYLPDTLFGEVNYTIYIESNAQRVVIDWEDRSTFLPILTASVTGDPKKGYNKIINQGGVITIE